VHAPALAAMTDRNRFTWRIDGEGYLAAFATAIDQMFHCTSLTSIQFRGLHQPTRLFSKIVMIAH